MHYNHAILLKETLYSLVCKPIFFYKELLAQSFDKEIILNKFFNFLNTRVTCNI